jgi:hypothetical protein
VEETEKSREQQVGSAHLKSGLIHIAVPMVLAWPSLTGGIAILKTRLIGIIEHL